MRTIAMLLLLAACDGTAIETTETDATDTDGVDQPDPVVGTLEGRWIVGDLVALPGQADTFWCVDAEVGDYEDETWLETGDPVECHEGSAGGCFNDLEFRSDGSIVRHVRYAARGPCPYDGETLSVVASEPWGSWELTGTDGEVDTFSVDGVDWRVAPFAEGVNVRGDGFREFLLVPGTGRHFTHE